MALATLALHLRDPHVQGSWGVCPTALLGFACPLCGGLRAVNDLTHVELVAAMSSNLLVVLGIPIVVGLWLRRLAACWHGGEAMRPLRVPPVAWWGLGLVVASFTLLRNLPVGAWFAP